MPDLPAVKVIGTGGTITSIGHDRFDFVRYSDIGTRIPINELLTRIPEAELLATLSSEDLYKAASSDIGPPEWIEIARRINQVYTANPETDGIVLTHGTGTMEETAYFLHLTVKSQKPVVMTGSMLPVTAIGTDADRNLYHAIVAAAHVDACGRGVMVCLNNQIHGARDVTKSDPLRVETFQSFGFGVLGYADSDGKVMFYRSTDRKHTTDTPFYVDDLQGLPRVDIIPIYAGTDDLLMNAARANGSAGVILAGVGGSSGSGTLKRSAEEAIRDGMIVVTASRTPTGRAVIGLKRQRSGFIAADNLSPLKARILLMLALTVTQDRDTIQKMFLEY